MHTFIKNKNFRKISIADFLSTAGDTLFYLAFITYASKLPNYSLALSLIAISESIPKLFDTFGGYLADKTKNKLRVIFLLAIIRFFLYLSVGILFISKINQWKLVIIILIINFISDTIGSYSSGLTTPLIVNLIDADKFGEAMGFTNGINQSISMIAQFIGAGLLIFISYSTLSFINSLTFLIAGILYITVKNDNMKDSIEDVNDNNIIKTAKISYIQIKKQHGLLFNVSIIALLNGILGAIGALLPIVIAGNSKNMIIYNYSFTIAIIGVIVSIGAILGSILGQNLFKNISIFILVIIALDFSIATTITSLLTNIYTILLTYFLLSFTVSSASIKMSQWVVSSIDHKILSSTVGFLNTIIMIATPITTSIFTSISGIFNITAALISLTITQFFVLIISINVKLKISKKARS